MKEKQSTEKRRMGRKPKFDYTGEEFLSTISDMARKGLTDREIAYAIGLSESTFFEQKAAHSEISEALSRARAKINTMVRAAFLKTALGGRMVRTTQYVQRKCECKGKDPDCKICDGTGWITPDQHKVVTETELAPNLMAQQRWLMNYDKEWKNRVTGDADESGDSFEGFDIEVTFNKKEDLELQERIKKKEE